MDMKPKVILLSGKKQVGKDTFASILTSLNKRSKYTWFSIALADELKHQISDILASLCGHRINDVAHPESKEDFEYLDFMDSFYNRRQDLKEKQIESLTYSDGNIVTPRNAMQWYGQMIKTTFGEHIWIDILLKNKIFLSEPNTNIIVTDCRFKYELKELKQRLQNKFEVITVRIKRNTGLEDKDISETDLDNLEDSHFDYILENNGSIKEFKKKVLDLNSVILKRG